MKAISVKQPWAWLIATERKSLETRTWATKYRGDLLICSSKKLPVVSVREAFQERFGMWATIQLRFGVALCVATLVDCRVMTKADEKTTLCVIYPNAMVWVLRNIRRIEPFAIKGKLGLYEVDYDLEPDK